ncbi:MAG: cysteine protease [Planctomycetota bacterium]|nr:cysteine protease [Planctomycetota bacterium]
MCHRQRPFMVGGTMLMLLGTALLSAPSRPSRAQQGRGEPAQNGPKSIALKVAIDTKPPVAAISGALKKFQNKGGVGYTGFVQRAIYTQLLSPQFTAKANLPNALAAAPQDLLGQLKPVDVEKAVALTATELSGLRVPNGLQAHAAERNLKAAEIRTKHGLAFAANKPLMNAWTNAVLSPKLSRMDWRDKGWVARNSGVLTPVRNQSLPESCGCCWAFATIAAYEAAQARTNLVRSSASVQNVLDCFAAKTHPTNGIPYDCSGGFWAFDLLINYGVGRDREYPYTGVQGACKDIANPFYRALNWGYVSSTGEIPSHDELKAALCEHGPVVAAVFAGDFVFGSHDGSRPISSFPSGPGQTGLEANGSRTPIDHAIVIVGWDDDKNAWIIKNSWGTDWGDQGYGYVDYDSNNVGFAAAWVSVKDTRIGGVASSPPPALNAEPPFAPKDPKPLPLDAAPPPPRVDAVPQPKAPAGPGEKAPETAAPKSR